MTIYLDKYVLNQGSLHKLVNSPVDGGALGVHKIELVVQPGPGLCDGCGVGQHAHGSGHLGQVTPPGTTVGGW